MRYCGKNIVEPDRSQMTIWRMSIGCWRTKATNTHSECVILIAFPRQQWLHDSTSVLRLWVHCLSCFKVQFFFRVSKFNANTANLQETEMWRRAFSGRVYEHAGPKAARNISINRMSTDSSEHGRSLANDIGGQNRKLALGTLIYEGVKLESGRRLVRTNS